MGFSLYLLEYYSKSAMLFKLNNNKEKKNRWSKDSLQESLRYYTRKSLEVRKMYSKYNEKDRKEIDVRVIELLRKESGGDDDDDDDLKEAAKDNDSKEEVYADCSFYDED